MKKIILLLGLMFVLIAFSTKADMCCQGQYGLPTLWAGSSCPVATEEVNYFLCDDTGCVSEGGDCSFSYDSCCPNTECNWNWDTYDWRCTDTFQGQCVQDGQYCIYDFDCCVGSSCRDLSELGESSYYVCVDDSAHELLKDGLTCFFDGECESGICINLDYPDVSWGKVCHWTKPGSYGWVEGGNVPVSPDNVSTCVPVEDSSCLFLDCCEELKCVYGTCKLRSNLDLLQDGEPCTFASQCESDLCTNLADATSMFDRVCAPLDWFVTFNPCLETTGWIDDTGYCMFIHNNSQVMGDWRMPNCDIFPKIRYTCEFECVEEGDYVGCTTEEGDLCPCWINTPDYFGGGCIMRDPLCLLKNTLVNYFGWWIYVIVGIIAMVLLRPFVLGFMKLLISTFSLGGKSVVLVTTSMTILGKLFFLSVIVLIGVLIYWYYWM